VSEDENADLRFLAGFNVNRAMKGNVIFWRFGTSPENRLETFFRIQMPPLAGADFSL